MFYGIEQSTDMRCPRTVVKKFTSESSLKKWLTNSGNFTYSDPDAARNHHRSFRYGYWLDGRINKKDEIFSYNGTTTYPRSEVDNLATYIRHYGLEIKE